MVLSCVAYLTLMIKVSGSVMTSDVPSNPAVESDTWVLLELRKGRQQGQMSTTPPTCMPRSGTIHTAAMSPVYVSAMARCYIHLCLYVMETKKQYCLILSPQENGQAAGLY